MGYSKLKSLREGGTDGGPKPNGNLTTMEGCGKAGEKG